jgi:hypothetical protein
MARAVHTPGSPLTVAVALLDAPASVPGAYPRTSTSPGGSWESQPEPSRNTPTLHTSVRTPSMT